MRRKADVVVVGAGAIGLCAAWYLQQAGRDVTVLSRDPVGVGASAGNAGMIVPSHIVPLSAPGIMTKGIRWLMRPESPFYIRPRGDLDFARWLWRFRASCTEQHVAASIPVMRDLGMSGLDRFDHLATEVGDFGFSRTGLLMLYRTEKGREENHALADRAASAGLRVRRLDEQETRALQPGLRSPFTGSVLFEDDSRIDPEAFVANMASALTSRGCDLRAPISVTGLASLDDGSVRVQTPDGPIDASFVVIAAGSWSPALARVLHRRVPVEAAKGYSVTVPGTIEGVSVPSIVSEEKLTLTPMPGRVRFAGTLSLTGLDPSVSTRRSQPIQRLARTYFPSIDIGPVWAGFRPCSPDGLPIIGPLAPGVLVATGHGMLGITHAPATGKLVSDLVLGLNPEIDAYPLRPSRFW